MSEPNVPTPQTSQPYPPPEPGRSERPLRRRREGRMLAGVAAGLADRLDMDVAVVRILIVVLTLLTEGFGVLAYLLAAVLIPAEEQGGSAVAAPARDRARDTQDTGRDPLFWVGVGLLVLGVLWLLGGPFASPVFLPGGRDLLWPLVLIGFGFALWRASERSDVGRRNAAAGTPSATAPLAPRPPAGYPPSTTSESTMKLQDTRPMNRPSSAGDAGTAPSGGVRYDQAPPAGDAGAPPPPTPPVGEPQGEQPNWSPPPVPQRERSLLTRVTLGIALVTAGILWLLRMTGTLAVSGTDIVAAALLVVGLGLLLGSVIGRGRWLILVGALLIPVIIVAELLQPFGLVDLPAVDVRDGAGEVAERPADLDDLRAEYRLAAGSLSLDLRELEIDRPTRVSLEVGAGEVIVRLPEDVTAEITARVGAGEISIGDRSTAGIGTRRSRTVERGEGSALLELDIRVAFGEVEVRPSTDVVSAPAATTPSVRRIVPPTVPAATPFPAPFLPLPAMAAAN